MKVFITGVSNGLGLYLAEKFLKSGDQVRGIGRRRFGSGDIKVEYQRQFVYYRCDTTQADRIAETFEELIHDDYIPDAIIFCAGSATDDINGKDVSLSKFKTNFRVNVFGIVAWIERFLPYFIERNRGTFAAVSSMSVYRETRKDRIAYSASRCALNKTFENLRIAYSASNVNFIVLNMGRMQLEKALIGISYPEAANRISNIIKSGRRSPIVNIPFSQYILTRIIQQVPEKIFKRYFFKK